MVCRSSAFSLFRILAFMFLANQMHSQDAVPLERAWRLAADGKSAQAVDLLQAMLARQPGDAEAHLLLGSLLAEAGEREKALAHLNEGARLKPNSSEAWNALGEACTKFGATKDALKAFERAVKLQPSFGVAQENLGAALLQSGESAQAAQHLDAAIPLLGKAPEAAEAEYLRAQIYSMESNFTKAENHLERAVALRPDFAAAWSDLGVARKAAQDHEGAVQAFQRAVTLDPRDPVAQYRLGLDYLQSSRPEMALPLLQEANRLNPDDQSTLNSLQSALQQLHRLEEAAAVRGRLAALLHNRDVKRQNEIKAFQVNNKGAELEKNGNLAAAVDCYREAIILKPDHAGIRANLGIALLRLGQWQEGLQALHEALALDPDNQELKFTMTDALSKAPKGELPDWAKEVLR